MFTGPEITDAITQLGFTHVVWLPDSTLGQWEAELASSPSFRLVRVCREGEAWPLAAGLLVGGQQPLVMMQTTGLFESGDALRNVLFDLRLPIVALIGGRNLLVENSGDSAKRFTEPILKAWGVDYRLIARPEEKPALADFIQSCLKTKKPGFVLLAERSG